MENGNQLRRLIKCVDVIQVNQPEGEPEQDVVEITETILELIIKHHAEGGYEL